MKKKGNSLPELCAENLIRIRRGEVAYERVKGLDGALIDQPSALIEEDAAADAERQISIFEPRIDIDSIDIAADGKDGGLDFSINIHRKEEEDNES